MLNHKVTIAIEDQVAVTTRRADLPQPHRPPARSHLRLPRAQGRPRRQVHHVGRRQGSPRASWSRPTRPARSTPASSAAPRTPACWSTWATTCCSCSVFPVPPKGDQKVALSYTCVAAKRGRPRRVRLPAQDRRQGRRDAGEVPHQRHHQVAARRHERLQPHARHHPASAPATSEVTVGFDKDQAPARQGLPALLRHRRQGRRPDRPDAPARSAPRTATSCCWSRRELELAKEYAGAARHGVGAGHLGQHARRQDGRRPARR